MIYVTENFNATNHLHMDTIKCYSLMKGFEFHLLPLKITRNCWQDDLFYLRHCLLADTMKGIVITIVELSKEPVVEISL